MFKKVIFFTVNLKLIFDSYFLVYYRIRRKSVGKLLGCKIDWKINKEFTIRKTKYITEKEEN